MEIKCTYKNQLPHCSDDCLYLNVDNQSCNHKLSEAKRQIPDMICQPALINNFKHLLRGANLKTLMEVL